MFRSHVGVVCLGVALSAALAVVDRASAVVPEYSILDLGTLGGTRSEAYGLNQAGQVVGWASTSTGGQQAFLTAPNSPINAQTDALPLLSGGSSSFAYGVNASGEVTGYGNTSGGARAFRYSGGTITALTTLGGAWSYGNAINSSGDIAGAAATRNNPNSPTDPTLYTGNVAYDLGTLGADGYAQAINASGEVAGYSLLIDGSTHAFVWTPTVTNGTTGTMLDIDPWGSTYSAAWGMNDAGEIVGGADTAGDVAYHAFLRNSDASHTVIDLNTLGGASSEARAINSLSMIVGTSDMPAGPGHAFLWSDGVMRDLNVLTPGASGWTLTNAMAINDLGQIAGFGTTSTGQRHAFLLSPVPTWRVDADGTWSVSSNWLGGVPEGAGSKVRFTDAITAPRSVWLDTAHTVGHVVFDSASSYTLSGAGTLSVSGPAGETGIEVRSGSHTIAAPLQFVSNAATIGLAAGSQLRLSGQVSGAVSQITLGTGATLDLASNALVVEYSSGESPFASIAAAIASGFSNNTWSGSGIISSTAAGDPTHATGIGYAEASALGISTFDGEQLTAPAVVMKYTYYGDANLDAKVDVTDLGALATNWQSSAAWTGGDFNYDGVVDVTDLGMLATNWQAGVTGTSASESLSAALAAMGLSDSNLPEPATAWILAACIVVARRRRR